MKYEFYAGSYGKKEEEGIIKFSLDGDTGNVEKIWGQKGTENPSWLTISSKKNVLYAVEETAPEGNIRAFEIQKDGLKPLIVHSTKGADPCHISLDGGESYLFTSNYSSGSLAVFLLDEKGIPVRNTFFVRHQGKGPDPARQEGPHIHFSKVSDNRVFTVDLGLDRVSVYHLDSLKGVLEDSGKYMTLPAGAGPRHLEFLPRIPELIYVVCEMGSSLAVFRETEERYILEGVFSTLPEAYTGENTAAAIRIHRDTLFVSNRGHDSIAVFSLKEDGKPVLEQIIPTGGRTPRDFQIFGDFIAVANQDSDEITVLKIDKRSGKLEQTGISVPMIRPVCICAGKSCP